MNFSSRHSSHGKLQSYENIYIVASFNIQHWFVLTSGHSPVCYIYFKLILAFFSIDDILKLFMAGI